MGSKVYVYVYLMLSAVYAVGALVYLRSITRTSFLARALLPAPGEPEPLSFGSDASRVDTQAAVRAVLSIDSAAFACAVLPVAYVALIGVFGSLLGTGTAASRMADPLWLLVASGLLGAHAILLIWIARLNARLGAACSAELRRSFVSRHASMLTYYRTFVLLVVIVDIVKMVYVLLNVSTVTRIPYMW